MVPQGESTGLAIEDGILLARVLERRGDRTVEQLFSDYEAVRKAPIDKHYSDADWMMNHGVTQRSWLMSILSEWMTWAFLSFRKWRQEEHFAGDVRKLELPA
jgi:2-polyprenyl-6-methoxyphenol hydroxylase-like FAD-dependent oxidoreductase